VQEAQHQLQHELSQQELGWQIRPLMGQRQRSLTPQLYEVLSQQELSWQEQPLMGQRQRSLTPQLHQEMSQQEVSWQAQLPVRQCQGISTPHHGHGQEPHSEKAYVTPPTVMGGPLLEERQAEDWQEDHWQWQSLKRLEREALRSVPLGLETQRCAVHKAPAPLAAHTAPACTIAWDQRQLQQELHAQESDF